MGCNAQSFVPHPPPRVVNVNVYNYPFRFSDVPIATILGYYGSIKNLGFQRWTNIPDVSTGTRLVCMTVLKENPRCLFINGFHCKIWYREQPLTCDICSKMATRPQIALIRVDASDQSGHMACDRPNPGCPFCVT